MKILYYFIYATAFIYALLPFRVLYILSDILFYFIYYILRYRRKIVRKNLINSFPDKSTDEIIKIEKDFYHHFCDYFFETIKMLHISDDEMRRRFIFENTDVIAAIFKEKRSAILMLGHHCNWEWLTSITLHVGEQYNVTCQQIYRPLKNKASDMFFLKLRKRFHSVGISKNDTLRAIVRLRRQNQQFIIGFMSDQKPSPKNSHYWTTFLNQETSILTGAERIATQTGLCVAYLDIRKVKRGYYTSRFEIITTEPQSLKEFEITEKYARLMEQTILHQPAYWLWTHNRWKHKRKDII